MAENGLGEVVEPPEPQPPGNEVAVREEKTRGRITNWALGIFTVTVVLSFAGIFTGHWEETKNLLLVILPLESTLIGAIAGYYLGTGNQA